MRILTLEPGHVGESISGHFDVVDARNAPQSQYEALSYAWGSSEKDSHILCQDQKLPITSNLHVALTRLRSTSRPRRLWIDQICINQDDLDERSAQVAMMGIIYRCASRVIVWLGDKDDTSDAAMTFAAALCCNLSLHNGRSRKELLTFSDLGKPVEGTDFILPDEKSGLWVALAKLLNREWFQRLWVVQEASLNPDTVVCCGASQIAWSVFTSLAVQLDAQAALYPFFMIEGQIAPGLHLAGSLISVEPLADVRDLLTVTLRFSKQFVTDPRDRIFAVLSLVNDPKSVSMVPDYTQDTATIYSSFARKSIEKADALDILHYVEMDDTPMATRLPSWVPDWRVRPHARPFGTEQISREIFSASGTKSATFWFGSLGQSLIVQGRKVGTLLPHGIVFPADSHLNMHSGKDESLHMREFELQSSLDSFFEEASKMVRNCHRAVQGSPDEILCHIFSRDYYKIFRPGHADLASAVRLLHLYRSTVKDGKEVLRRYLSMPEDSWIRKRFYDLDSLRVRLWWLAHLSRVMRNVEKRPSVAREGHAISMVFSANLRGNQIFTTSMGLLANVPRQSVAGDEVWILYGCKTPFILRRIERGHLLVGECFVHGIMYGEAIKKEMGIESKVELV
ncbi:MAG: hypothetical protein Q9190_004015 [Brigantiaea leucoxantha]